MSHVHRIIVHDGTRGPDHDCPDCLARETAQEELIAEFVRMEERIERLRVALRYIERPTMGTPGEFYHDLDGWIDRAPEANIRAAVKTCIRIAREALSSLDAQKKEKRA